MPKVYVVHDNPNDPKDFLPAEEYGDLIILFDRQLFATQIPLCYARMRELMRDAKPEDWLIPTGHPALIFAAGEIWSYITGQMNLLIWDGQRKRYIPMKVKNDGTNERANYTGQRTFSKEIR